MHGIQYIIAITLFLTAHCTLANSDCCSSSMDLEIDRIVYELNSELQILNDAYDLKYEDLYEEQKINLQSLPKNSDLITKMDYLIRKEVIEEKIRLLKSNEVTDISKIRYIKGLQIIQILYEKMLALDHHFASVSTLSEINKISNPNHYPAFANVKDQINSNRDKKKGFDLSEVLGNNIYTSVAHSLISLFTNTNTQKSKKHESLKEVECIMDFTLRMHNDLNTIYFETIFLQRSNENIMAQLHELFTDYTKPIGYQQSLFECRKTDDWDGVRELLSAYTETLKIVILEPENARKAQKMQINLEFPIDRLLQFINQYNLFIDQGAKFYEKFGIMLNSYENEQICTGQIPFEFNNLRSNITIAIEKFNTAYKPIEINGSKLKEVLYGINEYE